MKRLFPILLLAMAAIPALADDTASLNGVWQVQLSIADRDLKQECTFTQKESELSGACNSERGSIKLSGKVEGKSVAWSYRSDSEAGMVTVAFKGTHDPAGKISGTVTAVEYGVEGVFTATQAKPQ